MKEFKIKKIENIDINNFNSTLYFLYAKSIAMIKLMGLLSNMGRILVNPIELINQEFAMKFGTAELNELKLYYFSVFTLMDVLKFLEKNNIISRNMLYENLN